MKYIWKNHCMFSPLQVGFGRKLHHGGPSSANGAIWCQFDETTGVPQYLPDRQRDKSSSLKSPSNWYFHLALLLKGRPSCPRALSKLRLFTSGGSCFLTKVYLMLTMVLPKGSRLRTLMADVTNRKRWCHGKRKFWTLTSLIFKWQTFSKLHQCNLLHSSELCFSRQIQVRQ